jgi:hypothetical protein
MGHVVLLGDSIFDNGAYTGGDPDVITHLRHVLREAASATTWKATLAAVDGATTDRLRSQLTRVPVDATHLVVAIGGNDALQNSDLLSTRVRSTAEALTLFADRLAPFEASYRAAIGEVVALGRPVTVCTVYNGALAPDQATVARIGLTLFNDVILRVAFELRLGVIELRTICDERSDYANPIEPSGQGGLKIARAIARAIGALRDDAASRVWA